MDSNPSKQPLDDGDLLNLIEREDRLKRAGQWPDDGKGDQRMKEVEAFLAESTLRDAACARQNEPRYRKQKRRENLVLAALAALVVGVSLWAWVSTKSAPDVAVPSSPPRGEYDIPPGSGKDHDVPPGASRPAANDAYDIPPGSGRDREPSADIPAGPSRRATGEPWPTNPPGPGYRRPRD